MAIIAVTVKYMKIELCMLKFFILKFFKLNFPFSIY